MSTRPTDAVIQRELVEIADRATATEFPIGLSDEEEIALLSELMHRRRRELGLPSDTYAPPVGAGMPRVLLGHPRGPRR